MATPPPGPNFFIIGAPKCGTTALSEYLRGHEQVYVTDPKEPNFFNRDFDYYAVGDPDSLPGYLSLYDPARPGHIARGEASVWYLLSQVAAERIHAFAPDARLIAMVRDPVELVHSLHAQLLYTYDESEADFETAWRLQAQRRAGRSIPEKCRQPAFLQYAEVASVSTQLERFLRVFDREQLLVIVFDDFKRDAADAYRRALAHIGVSDDGRAEFAPVNESKTHRLRWLSNFTQRPPEPIFEAAQAIKRMIGVEDLGVMRRLRSANRKPQRRTALSPAFEAELRAFFVDEVRALGELLDRDLSAWSAERSPSQAATDPPAPRSAS